MAAGFDAGGNNQTFSQKRGRLSNDSGLFELLAPHGTILDSSNKFFTYYFSYSDPTWTPVSSVQKIKQGSVVG